MNKKARSDGEEVKMDRDLSWLEKIDRKALVVIPSLEQNQFAFKCCNLSIKCFTRC
jgi:hypothetical protein